MPILVDTGVLLGAIDADDAAHTRCAALLDVHAPGLLVPVTVIAEAAWQLENNVGVEAEAALIDSVIAGELTVVDITAADYVRAVELIRRYKNLGLGLVDASVIAIAERLNERHHHRHTRPARLHRCAPRPLRRFRADPLTCPRHRSALLQGRPRCRCRLAESTP